jgi:hypothetical protein
MRPGKVEVSLMKIARRLLSDPTQKLMLFGTDFSQLDRYVERLRELVKPMGVSVRVMYRGSKDGAPAVGLELVPLD